MIFETDSACCFTGHRKIDKEKLPALVEKLHLEIGWLIGHGIEHFVCGGALGFDTLAALTVLLHRQRGENAKLHLMLPCPDQSARWQRDDRMIYNDIMERADTVDVLCDHYHSGVMHARNRAMVDACRYCICFWDNSIQPAGKPGGGTLYTVNYARKMGRRIINLHDEPPEDGQLEFIF